jgi:hypothetical protein
MEKRISTRVGASWLVARGVVVAGLALAASGCDGKASAEPGGASSAKGGDAKPGDTKEGAAARLVGTWLSKDGDQTLVITATTLRREYKSVPDAPKVDSPYTVDTQAADKVTLTPHIVAPDGKIVKMSTQLFTFVGPDEITGGFPGKATTTFLRVK